MGGTENLNNSYTRRGQATLQRWRLDVPLREMMSPILSHSRVHVRPTRVVGRLPVREKAGGQVGWRVVQTEPVALAGE